jgi:hypothetical protein
MLWSTGPGTVMAMAMPKMSEAFYSGVESLP